MVLKITKTDAQWQELLSEEQYYIMRQKGTEPPFSGDYNDNKDSGEYLCGCCGAALFLSVDKFDSGTGWPSFKAPCSEESVATNKDTALSVVRTEVVCAECGAHLGHLFNDGPGSTGMRYCINSVSLKFIRTE